MYDPKNPVDVVCDEAIATIKENIDEWYLEKRLSPLETLLTIKIAVDLGMSRVAQLAIDKTKVDPEMGNWEPQS